MDYSKRKQLSTVQKQILAELINENPEIARKGRSNQYTSNNTNKKWKELAMRLNAVPGANKSWKEWRKTWSDIKTRTKKKKSNNKLMLQTGGGAGYHDEMSALENKILYIIEKTTVTKGNMVSEADIEIAPKIEVMEVPEETENMEEPKSVKPTELPKGGETTKDQSRRYIKTPVRRMPTKRKNNLRTSVEAANNIQAYAKQKFALKEEYYREKLKILREGNAIQERIATVLEKLANKLK